MNVHRIKEIIWLSCSGKHLPSPYVSFPTNQRHNSNTYTMEVQKDQKQKDLYYTSHHCQARKLPTFVLLHSGFSLSLSLKLEFVEVLCFLTETPWRLEFRLLQAHQRTVSNKKLTRFRHPFLSQSPTRKKYVEFLLPLGKSRPWEYAWSWRRKQRMISMLTKKLNPLMV